MKGIVAILLTMALSACARATPPAHNADDGEPFEVVKTDAAWRAELSAEEYRILRQAGTERAFTGKYWDNHAQGAYSCAGCGQPLFDSEHKFDSGTGWPSYSQPIRDEQVRTRTDSAYGMIRTEVVCGRCGGHLGHVFSDGPAPTGLRYCINGNAMDFEPRATENSETH